MPQNNACDCVPIEIPLQPGAVTPDDIRVYIDDTYIAISYFRRQSPKIEVYNVETREIIYTFVPPSSVSGVNHFGFSLNIIGDNLYASSSPGYIFIYSMIDGTYLSFIEKPHDAENSEKDSFGYGIADLGDGIVGFIDADPLLGPRYSYNPETEYLSSQDKNDFGESASKEHEVPRVAQEKKYMVVELREYTTSFFGIGIYKYTGEANNELEELYKIRYSHDQFVSPLVAINENNMFFATEGRIVRTNMANEPVAEAERFVDPTVKWIIANNKYVCIFNSGGSLLGCYPPQNISDAYITVYSALDFMFLGKIDFNRKYGSQNIMYIQEGDGDLFVTNKITDEGTFPVYNLSTPTDSNGWFLPDDSFSNLCCN